MGEKASIGETIGGFLFAKFLVYFSSFCPFMIENMID